MWNNKVKKSFELPHGKGKLVRHFYGKGMEVNRAAQRAGVELAGGSGESALADESVERDVKQSLYGEWDEGVFVSGVICIEIRSKWQEDSRTLHSAHLAMHHCVYDGATA